jgi:transcription elongation factor GreA
MVEEKILLTREGYELKKKRLEECRRILYEEIPRKLKIAIEHGGELRENKEYLDLKREQELYNAEVRQLEDLLDRAEIIDEENISTDSVSIGARVVLEDRDLRKVEIYELVGPAEVDLEKRKISIESPLGKALMGRRTGDEISIDAPTRKIRYRLLGIEKKS